MFLINDITSLKFSVGQYHSGNRDSTKFVAHSSYFHCVVSLSWHSFYLNHDFLLEAIQDYGTVNTNGNNSVAYGILFDKTANTREQQTFRNRLIIHLIYGDFRAVEALNGTLRAAKRQKKACIQINLRSWWLYRIDHILVSFAYRLHLMLSYWWCRKTKMSKLYGWDNLKGGSE